MAVGHKKVAANLFTYCTFGLFGTPLDSVPLKNRIVEDHRHLVPDGVEPRVLQHLLRSKAVGWLLRNQLAKEILAFLGSTRREVGPSHF